MTTEEKGQAVSDFVDEVYPPPVNRQALNEILYSFRECIGFPDYVDSVSEDQAILLFRIVERIRILGDLELPEELKV